MKKHDEVKHEDEKVNQPANAKVVSDSPAQPSLEVLSHQYQENSPAINTNVVAGYGVASENIMDKLDPDKVAAKLKAEEDAKEPVEKLTEAEYLRRTHLDVSHKDYINPSQDHPAKGKK